MKDPASDANGSEPVDPRARAKSRKLAAVGGGVLLAALLVTGFVVSGSGDNGGSTATGTGSSNATSLPSGESATGFLTGPNPAAAIAIKHGTQTRLLAAAKQAGCTFHTNPDRGFATKYPDYDFKYDKNPPTSGNQPPTWAEDGAYNRTTYDTPDLVHALAHGRVEYLWDPKMVSKLQIGSVNLLFESDSYHLILHPDTTHMPYAIAATAWDHSLTCPKMNNGVFAALRLFKLVWIDKGPERVP